MLQSIYGQRQSGQFESAGVVTYRKTGGFEMTPSLLDTASVVASDLISIGGIFMYLSIGALVMEKLLSFSESVSFIHFRQNMKSSLSLLHSVALAFNCL